MNTPINIWIWMCIILLYICYIPTYVLWWYYGHCLCLWVSCSFFFCVFRLSLLLRRCYCYHRSSSSVQQNHKHIMALIIILVTQCSDARERKKSSHSMFYFHYCSWSIKQREKICITSFCVPKKGHSTMIINNEHIGHHKKAAWNTRNKP